MKSKKKLVTILTAWLITSFVIASSAPKCIANDSNQYRLSERREDVAAQIADICIEHWKDYGIWPSVAIGQAFVESGLGTGPNLFGCLGHSGKGVVEATYGYLEVLQNQYFRGEANFADTPEDQLAIIMRNGRYCEGEYPYGTYYYNVIRSINKYGWRKYDECIKKMIQEEGKEQLRRLRQNSPFHIIFSEELTEGACRVDPEWIKKGSSIVYPGGVCEATHYQERLNNTIVVGVANNVVPKLVVESEFFNLDELDLHIQVFEDAKG